MTFEWMLGKRWGIEGGLVGPRFDLEAEVDRTLSGADLQIARGTLTQLVVAVGIRRRLSR